MRRYKQRGNIIISIIIVLLVAAGLASIWYLGKDVITEQLMQTYLEIRGLNQTTDILQGTEDWLIFDRQDLPVSYKYPPNWYINNATVSEYPYDVNQISARTYNIVSVSEMRQSLYGGYFNDYLFNKLYSLPKGGTFTREYYNPAGEYMEKISSGRIADKQHRYVIFKIKTNNLQSSSLDNVHAYILEEPQQSVIIYTLRNYDDEGQTMFEKIVASSQLRH